MKNIYDFKLGPWQIELTHNSGERFTFRGLKTDEDCRAIAFRFNHECDSISITSFADRVLDAVTSPTN